MERKTVHAATGVGRRSADGEQRSIPRADGEVRGLPGPLADRANGVLRQGSPQDASLVGRWWYAAVRNLFDVRGDVFFFCQLHMFFFCVFHLR